MNRRNIGLAAKCLAIILFTCFFSTRECKSGGRQIRQRKHSFLLSQLVGNTKRGGNTCPRGGGGLINGASRARTTTQWRNNHLNFSRSGGDRCTHGSTTSSTTSMIGPTTSLTTSSSPPLWARKIDQKEIKRRKNYQYALKHKFDKNGRRIKDINKERKSLKKKKLFDYEGFKVDKIFTCLSEEDMQELREEELKRKSGEILHNNKYIDTYGVESETDMDDL
ncbi:hypothetical protein C922_01799 [Plasmodium inui San Antonio 1]|uniref:Uncharacterized protein n=1 Tax=Plasmodium inui San Antonio 1 TaxID=1237626 RepID=W7AF13_9APIC|nr:hypothetical protein C922_01799 [Plasmodium inui San Antonio 1]EUD67614.1 hypothetical protein C922_01799 [Plasmodium inui San Antonio 1]